MPDTTHPEPTRSKEERRPVQPATDGVGPILERDFVVVVRNARLSPEELIRTVRERFPEFSPDSLARFKRPDERPIGHGDTMQVWMPGAGTAGVRVAHVGERGFTLRTLQGHFESGMITFGADRDEQGRLVFRIRSRSSIASPIRRLMYHLGGIHVQTRIWTTFCRRVAEASGGEMIGDVLSESEIVPEGPEDRGEENDPTFETAHVATREDS